MKPSILLLLGFVVACSRDETGRAGSGDDGAPPTAPYVARISAGPLRWPEEYPTHFFSLFPTGGAAVTGGDEPSADHPAGTVYVVGEAPPGSSRLGISEWDLAAGKELRRQKLPLHYDGDARVLHHGDRVHLVARGPGEGNFSYVMLDSSFRILSRNRVDPATSTADNSLTTDGTLTFVVGVVPSIDGAPGGAEAYGATFNAQGRPVAVRAIPYNPGETLLWDCGAVLQGTPYMLRYYDRTLRLHELTPDLKEVVSTIVPTKGDLWPNQATIWARGNRLVVDAPPLQQFEFSPDLTEMREISRRPPRGPHSLEDKPAMCWRSATVGPNYALLCYPDATEKDRTTFIAWDQQQR